MAIFSKHRSASLIEILITLTIFSIVAGIAVQVLSNSLRSAKRLQLQAFLFNESQSVMDQIGRTIEQSAIDYEAYFSRNVLHQVGRNCRGTDVREACWNTPLYGFYGMSFYHPGEEGGASGTSRGPSTKGPFAYNGSPFPVIGYGQECPEDETLTYPYRCDSNVISTQSPDVNQADFNTGVNPFTGFANVSGNTDYSADDASAFTALCRPDAAPVFNAHADYWEGVEYCKSFESTLTNEVILINAAGDYRVIFALRDDDIGDGNLYCEENEHCRLVMLEMLGIDSDSTGLINEWSCKSEYSCPASSDDITLEHFKPITPADIDIENFDVFVTPAEDPYRAFLESDVAVQPQITIFMTASLSLKYGRNYLGTLPKITLQRTVSTGVYHEIVTYE